MDSIYIFLLIIYICVSIHVIIKEKKILTLVALFLNRDIFFYFFVD